MSDAVFVKRGPASSLDMFEAEAEGLYELAAANAVRVPKVHDCGIDDRGAFIAMERLNLTRPSAKIEQQFGDELAALHRHTSDRFGWHRANTIGLTPQQNDWRDDWLGFLREHRLLFQLNLAAANGYVGEIQDRGQELAANLGRLFDGYQPERSLLHGDLWGGNWGASDGAPVIFDPAVYYGDRESDIAMTKLFGGFGREFYRSYESAWPLAAGSDARIRLYQLYHVLNHLNLFGRGYLGQSMSLLKALEADVSR